YVNGGDLAATVTENMVARGEPRKHEAAFLRARFLANHVAAGWNAARPARQPFHDFHLSFRRAVTALKAQQIRIGHIFHSKLHGSSAPLAMDRKDATMAVQSQPCRTASQYRFMSLTHEFGQ